ncbi:hypothetical protein H0N95_00215 [Candidatus Micrarchaeota archaeon]|nr:hypothetical protein [Candidatus Micrarchaeota archaeon]
MGYIAFLLGVFIAIISGLFYAAQVLDSSMQGFVALVLVVLGLVVGLLNLLDKDATPFLLAVIAIEIAGSSAGGIARIDVVGPALGAIVNYIGVFVFPAAVIVALKIIWDMSKI